MRIPIPTRLHNRLSLLSVFALAGLVVFAAAVILVANPFGVSASGGANGSSAVQGAAGLPQSQQAAGNSTGQGSLLTGAPPAQGPYHDSGHHHHEYGNSGLDD